MTTDYLPCPECLLPASVLFEPGEHKHHPRPERVYGCNRHGDKTLYYTSSERLTPILFQCPACGVNFEVASERSERIYCGKCKRSGEAFLGGEVEREPVGPGGYS